MHLKWQHWIIFNGCKFIYMWLKVGRGLWSSFVLKLLEATWSNNICGLMVKVLPKFGWLGLEELRRKLMNMGYDGSNVFQGHWTCVTLQFQKRVAPFLIRMHCFAHKTNLIVIILSKLDLVCQLKAFLQNLYVFLPMAHKSSKGFKNLQICSIPRVTNYLEMWRLDGYPCCFQQNKYMKNTILWLWKCMLKVQKVMLWMCYVTLSSFLRSFVSSHCLSVCTPC